MLIKRSILIFPKFGNMDILHQFRANYDPLHNLIQPHITLVHPFLSNLTLEQLQGHVVESAKGIKPFRISLQGFSGTVDRYLFLDVEQGSHPLIELHDHLYNGILAEYLNCKIPYVPHITVGKLETVSTLNDALERARRVLDSFESVVSEITVEIIDDREQSNTEIVVSL
jgi:2'-5' RNA ligase